MELLIIVRSLQRRQPESIIHVLLLLPRLISNTLIWPIQSSSSLFQCTIDTTSGDLSSCSEHTDGNIDAAFGIAFNTDENGAHHAYVADAAAGMVVCPMDATTGSFMSPPGCAITPSLGAPSWIPYSITFNTASGTRYAYVADNGVGANLGMFIDAF